jgi:hypothetical protein
MSAQTIRAITTHGRHSSAQRHCLHAETGAAHKLLDQTETHTILESMKEIKNNNLIPT